MAIPLPGAPPTWVAYSSSGVAVIANERLPIETRFIVVTMDALVPSNNRLGCPVDGDSASLACFVESWREHDVREGMPHERGGRATKRWRRRREEHRSIATLCEVVWCEPEGWFTAADDAQENYKLARSASLGRGPARPQALLSHF